MINVEEASQIVLRHVQKWEIQEVAISEAVGYVLAEPLLADRAFPPFDRVMMDGVAINFEDWENGTRSYEITAVQGAGQPATVLEGSGNCIEIMTGSVLPQGANAVIPYEHFLVSEEENKKIVLLKEGVRFQQNIHFKGEDRAQGDVLVKAGVRLGSTELAVAAAVGKAQIKVLQKPRVALISTGDELVEVGQQPESHQIRRSNVYALQAACLENGMQATLYHLRDDPDAMKAALEKILEKEDVLILSGGVSKGKFDFLPEILTALKVKKHFHKVKQRPGKPFWFGTSESGKAVFALPGNPVSTFMCFHRYVLPWYRQTLGWAPFTQGKAILSEDFRFGRDLSCFLQVRVERRAEGTFAHPFPGKGSGDFANLLEADGFLELPAEINEFKKGEIYALHMFKAIN